MHNACVPACLRLPGSNLEAQGKGTASGPCNRRGCAHNRGTVSLLQPDFLPLLPSGLQAGAIHTHTHKNSRIDLRGQILKKSKLLPQAGIILGRRWGGVRL